MDLFGFEIRSATVEDFAQLCVLFEELDDLHRRARPDLFHKPDGPPRELTDVTALIAGPESTILVAEDKAFGQLVGFVTVIIRQIPAQRLRAARRIVEIDNFDVSRYARRHGIGRALIRETIEWAAVRDFDSIELGVHEFNAAAVGFYSAMGFKTTARRLNLKFTD